MPGGASPPLDPPFDVFSPSFFLLLLFFPPSFFFPPLLLSFSPSFFFPLSFLSFFSFLFPSSSFCYPPLALLPLGANLTESGWVWPSLAEPAESSESVWAWLILSTQHWVLIRSTEYSALSTEYCVLTTDYWVLSSEYLVLSIKYWVLNTEYWVRLKNNKKKHENLRKTKKADKERWTRKWPNCLYFAQKYGQEVVFGIMKNHENDENSRKIKNKTCRNGPIRKQKKNLPGAKTWPLP